MSDHSDYPAPNGGATRFKMFEAPGSITLVPSKDGKYYPYRIDEIERLRARIEECENSKNLLSNSNYELCEKITALRARIEELEAKVSEQVRLRAHELRTFHPEDHVTIPNERIDKAWAKIQTRAEPVYHQGMERALEIIGIVDDGEGGWRMSHD